MFVCMYVCTKSPGASQGQFKSMGALQSTTISVEKIMKWAYVCIYVCCVILFLSKIFLLLFQEIYEYQNVCQAWNT